MQKDVLWDLRQQLVETEGSLAPIRRLRKFPPHLESSYKYSIQELDDRKSSLFAQVIKLNDPDVMYGIYIPDLESDQFHRFAQHRLDLYLPPQNDRKSLAFTSSLDRVSRATNTNSLAVLLSLGKTYGIKESYDDTLRRLHNENEAIRRSMQRNYNNDLIEYELKEGLREAIKTKSTAIAARSLGRNIQ